MKILLGCSDAMNIPLADQSVHMVCCSPPYWGLRDYGLGDWQGGDAECDHKPTGTNRGKRGELPNPPAGWAERSEYEAWETCPKCGAVRSNPGIGLEPTIDEYLASMVAFGREVWRVLRDDGTLWLNLGDSYASTPAGNKNCNMNERFSPNHKTPVTYGGNKRNTVVGGLKPKDLCGIPWRVALALQADGWYLRSDIIWAKCLAHSTRVYARTQKGDMPATIGELARLDPSTIKLWTGEKWARVKTLEETAESEGIEIEFRNGQRVSCTPEHRWVIDGIGLEVEAKDLTIGTKLKSVTLPDCDGDPSHLPPVTIGYFVGMYLAEGSRGKGGKVIQIASHKKEKDRYATLSNLARRYDGTCRMHNTNDGNAATINIYGSVLTGIIDQYISGKTAKNKHLSMKCWQRSNKFLHSVLKGYLDGDGYYEELTGQWRLGFTRNDALANDLRTICARLGYSIRLKRTWHKYQGGKSYGFRGNIQMDIDRRRTHDWEIVGLRKSKSRKFYDIEIESPHVFALACGLATHNSNPMPESVTDRPTKSHEYVFLLTKQPRYFYDADAVREASIYPEDNRKARSKNGQKRLPTESVAGVRPRSAVYPTRNRRTVWNIATQPYAGAHFATWPEALVEPMVKAGTSEKGCCPICGAQWKRVTEKTRPDSYDGKGIRHGNSGNGMRMKDKRNTKFATTGFRPTCDHEADPVPCIVLDPFTGSGTTNLVARRLGRNSIGLDLSFDYLQNQAKERLGITKLEQFDQGIVDETGSSYNEFPLFRSN